MSADYYIFSKKIIDSVTNNIDVFIIDVLEQTIDRISLDKLKVLLKINKRIVTMQINEDYNFSFETFPLLNIDTVLTFANMDQEISKLAESPHDKPSQWKITKSGSILVDIWKDNDKL